MIGALILVSVILVIPSIKRRSLTISAPLLHLTSSSLWSIWFSVIWSGDDQVTLWTCLCGNIPSITRQLSAQKLVEVHRVCSFFLHHVYLLHVPKWRCYYLLWNWKLKLTTRFLAKNAYNWGFPSSFAGLVGHSTEGVTFFCM